MAERLVAADASPLIGLAAAGAFHLLAGGRKNEWSVSVSGNWRITFEEEDGHIDRLHFEDYH